MADDDVLADVDEHVPAPPAGRARASAAGEAAATARRKGRGARPTDDGADDRYAGKGGVFDALEGEASGGGPLKSIEGWIVMITGVHEEAQEDDVLDAFTEYGEVKNINLNLDRRTGFVKGYALLEYASKKEAEKAIAAMNGKEILGKPIAVDWAFVKETSSGGGGGGGGRRR